ncbi:MAG TPA: hypothetical protein PKW07_09335 [Syntrophorhabdaceae bacterium]|nr:hypothetical protein [Syntrophorhabdaceae bacterium]
MEIYGKTIMVLGGYGEVGMAVCRLLLKYNPSRLIVTSLREEEAVSAVNELSREAPESCSLVPFYGNIFVRWELKDKTLLEIAQDDTLLKKTVDDNLGELTDDMVTSSTLYKAVIEHKPHIIVDCINTATALAYRNIFQSYESLIKDKCQEEDVNFSKNDMRRIFLTVSIPPLIRHIQILYETLKRAEVNLYVKVGTTGTGGMGLNIPFTHGEEMPSRLLMSKSAVAGAHSMLLFALSNTPGSPIIKEVKPAAMIGWKQTGKGEIKKGGRPVKLYDCPKNDIYHLQLGSRFSMDNLKTNKSLEGESLKGTFIDTGENGVFSMDEFKAITSLGLMEFITPEEIAHTVIDCIKGSSNSKDVISAIDASVLGPTYRAGFLRDIAIRQMERLGREGFSYGLLGPKLSKLIFEASLFMIAFGFMEDVLERTPEEISSRLEDIVFNRDDIRKSAISIGIPILLKDGKSLLFAKRDVMDKVWESGSWEITVDNINRFAEKEWIDLREDNIKKWQTRFITIKNEKKRKSLYYGSCCDLDKDSFQPRDEYKTPIDPGDVSAWILIKEFKGARHELYESTRLIDT